MITTSKAKINYLVPKYNCMTYNKDDYLIHPGI